MEIRLSPCCLYLARVLTPAICAEYAIPENVLIPSVVALDQLAPARTKASVHLDPLLPGSALQAQICHLPVAPRCPHALPVGLYPLRLSRSIRARMILILTEADMPTVGAGIDLPLLHLALPAQRTGALGYQLQLSITARRAHFGGLPAKAGQGFAHPALWATVGGLGGRVEGSAGKAYQAALAIEAKLLGLLSPIHRLTPFLFSF